MSEINGNMHRAVALIDYENIGTLNYVPLFSYGEIIIFTGAMQTELRLPATKLGHDIRIMTNRDSVQERC